MTKVMRRFLWGQQILFHRHTYAALPVGPGQVAGRSFCLSAGVAHGKGPARPAQQLQVVARVPKGHDHTGPAPPFPC